MTKIAQQDMPLLITWIIIVIAATYFWIRFVFKRGAESMAGKNFIFGSTIMPSMTAKRLKILASVLYFLLIGMTIFLFL